MLLIRSSSRNQCDPDFYVCIFSSEHQFVRLQEKNVIKIFLFARSRSSIGATNSLAFKEPMRSRFFCSRFCERASIRSPSGNHLHPPFSLAGGEPGRRGDHFWVRSRVELNLEALACYPRTSKEPTRAPWNVFFHSFHFSFSFSLFFFPFQKPSFRTNITLHEPLYITKTPS